MMRVSRLVGAISIIWFLFSPFSIHLANEQEPSETRQTSMMVKYIQYEWYMLRWGSDEIVCRIFTDHEGLPTVNEASIYCGTELATEWSISPPCKTYMENDKEVVQCPGLYLLLFSEMEKEREVIIDLPHPTAWINLDGCSPSPPENRCLEIPSLLINGEEPLTDQKIIAVQGTIAGEPFYCEGDTCLVPLKVTTLQGVTVEFWVDSSYGDSSEKFTAQIRVIDTGVAAEPDGGGWYVDVISSQWLGAPLASCAGIWDAFPSVGTPPRWLATPDDFQLLATDDPLYYLAGRIISQGLVDVSECASGGILPNGYADACGLEKAHPIVEDWQNQFDQRIIEVAKETGIPAQLMKNLFAQESQFWPGEFRVKDEFGLGQITDMGADSIFLWNPEFFNSFCPLVLSEDACNNGYLGLQLKDQAILRGALALQARADCPDCPTGVDLSNTNFSVSLFANTLQANCSQVSRTIYTATELMSGSIATYEDLWRFTIANYHVGPGCVSYAIHQAWENSGILTWEEVKTYFTDPCKSAVPYVEKITQ